MAALEQAIRGYGACGAAWRRGRAVGALRQLRNPGRRAAGPLQAGSLTRRGRDVARLAAKGMSARQIAEAPRNPHTHRAGASNRDYLQGQPVVFP